MPGPVRRFSAGGPAERAHEARRESRFARRRPETQAVRRARMLASRGKLDAETLRELGLSDEALVELARALADSPPPRRAAPRRGETPPEPPDPAAVARDELLSRFRDELFAFLLLVAGPGVRTELAYQRAAGAALSDLAEFDAEAGLSFRAWVLARALGSAEERLRAGSAERPLRAASVVYLRDGRSGLLHDLVADAATTGLVLRRLEALPARERAAVALARFLGMDRPLAAKVAGLPRGTDDLAAAEGAVLAPPAEGACASTRARLEGYLASRLEAKEARSLAGHFASCARCREALEASRAFAAGFAALAGVVVQLRPPPGLAEAALAAAAAATEGARPGGG